MVAQTRSKSFFHQRFFIDCNAVEQSRSHSFRILAYSDQISAIAFSTQNFIEWAIQE
ncbi:hypothetical protein [Planktothrix sp. FACHB-1365]|uniref:hypothetical protein n=1 Tax=Planktothrix sp. FACHB-1365 TaxID=2692855 RepID=UPI0016866006|nr:hypothetical protein [Planktothrix sp. FACHB-1365]MBD2483761.1 hypothetical protein [Planktothrix sp. FACHB-1365]